LLSSSGHAIDFPDTRDRDHYAFVSPGSFNVSIEICQQKYLCSPEAVKADPEIANLSIQGQERQ
jgi:hypothetical protein